MTDTTNHAEAIRNWTTHYRWCRCYDRINPGECNCGCTKPLDALTREARTVSDELKDIDALFHEDAFPGQAVYTKVRITCDRVSEQEATIAAQSERIKALEPYLSHLPPCLARRTTDEHCTCGLRAALAPKEKS